jgi:peptidoglycan/xylan/chitin deacetylase (PgdA/CDA1 family)
VHPSINHYTSVSPANFEYAIDLMIEWFQPFAIHDLFQPEAVIQLPKHPTFLITLDDGYLDNWEYALPILEKRGLQAIFFVITSLVGSGGSDRKDSTKGYMAWNHLRQLLDKGHIIGAHSVSHRDLSCLSQTEVEKEIGGSLLEIQEKLGVQPRLLAYPYGQLPTIVPFIVQELIVFGTVKALPRPWNEARHNIRRTYLPADSVSLWNILVKNWYWQWFAQ